MQKMHSDSRFSYAAIGIGTMALCLALVHAFAGPFAPTQSLDVTIGEFAANIRAAAERALAGVPQPEPVAEGWNIDRILKAAIPAAGVLSLLLAIVGIVRREPKRAAVCGLALGIGAITVQVAIWAVMTICAALVIVAIVHNIGDILGNFGA
jgi:hypothetical protein